MTLGPKKILHKHKKGYISRHSRKTAEWGRLNKALMINKKQHTNHATRANNENISNIGNNCKEDKWTAGQPWKWNRENHFWSKISIKFESQEWSVFDRCWGMRDPPTTAAREEVKGRRKGRWSGQRERNNRKEGLGTVQQYGLATLRYFNYNCSVDSGNM